MTREITYLDPTTGEHYPLAEPRWCSEARRPLMLSPLPGIGRSAIERSEQSLWRYRASLPIPDAAPISMGEGMTPLVSVTIRARRALLKCEWVMPSGSFKDRGASVMLSLLKAAGITAVLEDSSGNGGAAVAAYAAAGGLKATILSPAATSPEKLLAMRAYGAVVELVPGDRQATADAALLRSHEIFYASHNWHPFFLEGTKTLAYELWEQLGFHAPDAVVVPCGAGSNVLGLWLGFSELKRVGEIATLPRIFAVQPENCAPIAASFRAGTASPVVSIKPTIAEGTAIAHPVRLGEVLRALRESQGGVVTLTEAEIAQATLAAARMGCFVEPTGAEALGGFFRLLDERAIGEAETCVLVLTGSGLKAGPRIAELLASRGRA